MCRGVLHVIEGGSKMRVLGEIWFMTGGTEEMREDLGGGFGRCRCPRIGMSRSGRSYAGCEGIGVTARMERIWL